LNVKIHYESAEVCHIVVYPTLDWGLNIIYSYKYLFSSVTFKI